jgi:hypothetical protein
MNKDRRKRLEALAGQLRELPDVDELRSELQTIYDDEDEAFNAMPESLQNGERGQLMQEALQAMQDVLDALDNFSPADMIDNLERAAE